MCESDTMSIFPAGNGLKRISTKTEDYTGLIMQLCILESEENMQNVWRDFAR